MIDFGPLQPQISTEAAAVAAADVMDSANTLLSSASALSLSSTSSTAIAEGEVNNSCFSFPICHLCFWGIGLMCIVVKVKV